jgi:hypothetical protein
VRGGRRPRRSGQLRLLAWLAAGSLAGAAEAAAGSDREALAARYPELHAAIYEVTVCEYCGLITPDVAAGFHQQVRELIALHGLTDATVREIRIAAWTRADLEWANRGVGGFRGWCRSEGEAAAERFAAHAHADGAE